MCISNSQTTKPARIVWGLGESDRTESESLCVYRRTRTRRQLSLHGPRARGKRSAAPAVGGGGPRAAASLPVRAARRGRGAPVYRLRSSAGDGRRARQPRNSRAWELGPAGPTRRDERQRRRPKCAQLGAQLAVNSPLGLMGRMNAPNFGRVDALARAALARLARALCHCCHRCFACCHHPCLWKLARQPEMEMEAQAACR